MNDDLWPVWDEGEGVTEDGAYLPGDHGGWQEIEEEENPQDSGTNGEFEGTGGGSFSDSGEDIPGNDAGGTEIDEESSGSSEDGGVSSTQDSDQVDEGQTEGESEQEDSINEINQQTVIIDGQPVSVSVVSDETFTGVTSEQFEDYRQEVKTELDGISAMQIVLVFAIFLCAGMSAVDTLMRSFE